MARIRIVDEWLRSPVSSPVQRRAIMVVARSWAEQRVLMRAFSSSDDQTRPTIHLHGAELAVGPAGTDPHGEWGIHVEPPVDGRAQELRGALELAARLLAGSKGNPARLQDEVSDFDDRATGHWKPEASAPSPAAGGYYEPIAQVETSPSPPAAVLAAAQTNAALVDAPPPTRVANVARARRTSSPVRGGKSAALRRTPPPWGKSHDAPKVEAEDLRRTFRHSGALPAQQWAHASARAAVHTPRRRKAAKTVFGVPSANKSIAGSEGVEPQSESSTVPRAEGLSTTARRTMPLGLKFTPQESQLLDALGRAQVLTASEVRTFLGVEDPLSWMGRFMDKLAEFGLDLVTPGEDQDGEPTYLLTG